MDVETIAEIIASGVGREATYSQRCMWWMALLGILISDPSEESQEVLWIDSLHSMRNRYEKLKNDLFAKPDLLTEDDDPLSATGSGNSTWSKYFQDEELCKSIRLDLDRTHPESDFFQTRETQEAMLNILFIWARLNSDVSYRQGLNELLSPIYLLVAKSHTSKEDNENLQENGDFYQVLAKENFIEHDAFSIFESLMLRMKKYFALTNDLHSEKSKEGLEAHDPLKKEEKVNAVVAASEKIQRKLLKRLDPKLADHLNSIGVEPQIYGLYDFFHSPLKTDKISGVG